MEEFNDTVTQIRRIGDGLDVSAPRSINDWDSLQRYAFHIRQAIRLLEEPESQKDDRLTALEVLMLRAEEVLLR